MWTLYTVNSTVVIVSSREGGWIGGFAANASWCIPTPQWCIEGAKSPILLAEAIAILMNLLLFKHFFEARTVILLTDNSGCYFGLIRGASACPLTHMVIRCILTTLQSYGSGWWLDWVASKWNPSDAVSRRRLGLQSQLVDLATLRHVLVSIAKRLRGEGTSLYHHFFTGIRDRCDDMCGICG